MKSISLKTKTNDCWTLASN